MSWFPFFIQLENAPGLLVGGGQVALRKAEKLLSFGPKLTVVAPEICPELAALEGPNLTLCRRPFCESDLDPLPAFVIAATSDPATNRRIAALVQRGRLTVGISTGGASPTAAAWLRKKIEALLPEGFAGLLDRLEAKRAAVKAACPGEESARAALLRAEFQQELAALSMPEMEQPGRVALVGAGCGKADLITVRGLRLLRRCRAVVYDDLLDPELLAELPAGAETYYVGKRSGCHSAAQQEINALLVRLARQGGLVVRLKGGDPFVFGRGGEEALALQKAGIPFEVVPGISSAIAIPAEAGIPVTHRAMSREVHIITAHTGPGKEPDYRRYAGLEGTLVFLMGLARLPQIAQGLMDGGMSPDTPAAVLSGGSAAHPAAVRAPLAEIAHAAQKAGVQAPAVILVGRTAELRLI